MCPSNYESVPPEKVQEQGREILTSDRQIMSYRQRTAMVEEELPVCMRDHW